LCKAISCETEHLVVPFLAVVPAPERHKGALNPDPEPQDPEPKDPEPKDPEPKDPEPKDPEPIDLEPKDLEPIDLELRISGPPLARRPGI